MGVQEPLSGAQRVAQRRANLRRQGLRPRQFWLPDLRSTAVRKAVQADAAALARQAHRWDDVLAELEALQDGLFTDDPTRDEDLPEDDEPEAAVR